MYSKDPSLCVCLDSLGGDDGLCAWFSVVCVEGGGSDLLVMGQCKYIC